MDAIFDGLNFNGGLIPVAPTNFPAPVLAEPIAADKKAKQGEARESTTNIDRDTIASASDSRDGGKPLDGNVKTDSVDDRTQSLVSGAERALPSNPLAEILDRLEVYLSHYVNFPLTTQSAVVALWVAHTWIFDRFRYSPMLHIFSPEKRCGKSVLLDALTLVVARPWKIDNLSEAALFHKADLEKPTMLWDEVDNVFTNEKDNAPIIGLLNAGFKKGGKAVRVPRGNLEEYDVYCPKALCGIGRIPDTTHDRCIDVKLARAKGKNVFRDEEAESEAKGIRDGLSNYFRTLKASALKEIDVTFPSEYKDDGRKCDITEPLLIIATLAGPEWLDKANFSLGDICSNVDDLSVGIQLLKDCREIFLNRAAERLTTETMLNDLINVEDADSPWPVWWEGDVKFGKIRGPAKKLASLLNGYGIRPHQIRTADGTSKGYVKADFHDAWERYLGNMPTEMRNAELDLDL